MSIKKGEKNKISQKRLKSKASAALSRNLSLVVFAVIFLFAVLFFWFNDIFFKIPGIPSFDEMWGIYKPVVCAPENDDVQVHFIDVGQGDCELILYKDMSVLIDSGEYDMAGTVINHLKSLGIEKLDYVICTHPHSDHIGGMSLIVKYLGVDNAIMPQIPDEQITATSSLKRMLEAFDECSVNVRYCQNDTYIPINENCRLEFIYLQNSYENLNNCSIVCRLVHYNNTFLFTGDIEEEAELDIVNSQAEISADVIKVPHHGSRTSCLYSFLKKAAPKYAVIEVGSPNDFGHPHDKTLNVYKELFCRILRTDVNGTIVFTSNKDKLTYITEKE